ncbi:MAG: PEP-CTERM sorting domain-containing protein [Planctomycetes bacterium]|nr:PEP-CTERM sorting domain-containing protein [Planctomycetota bacterium]
MRHPKFIAQPLRALPAATLLAIFAFAAHPALVSAGVFNWGDLSDPGGNVVFLDVEEDNALPTSLFAPMPGSGSPNAVGNSLILDPQNFLSQATNGSDAIDSEFSTTLMVGPSYSIDDILISEFGDFTLGGLPGSLATAQVGASFFWQVLEVDGVAVSLPMQTQPLIVTTGGGPNGGIYERSIDDGIATPWEGYAQIDVAGYLDANLIVGDATKVSLLFDNTLLTAADLFSSALIKKKGVQIDVSGDGLVIVPEPASLALFGIGGLALLGGWRGRQR